MDSSAPSLNRCPVVLLQSPLGPPTILTGQGYSGIMAHPPCGIVVTNDGSTQSSQTVRDLTQHIDDAIRDFAIHLHNVSTVRCSRHVWRASDCENLMPQESIRVLVIVGNRDSPSLPEDSALGRLCKDWTELKNSYILPVAQEGTDINNWLPQFVSKLNASFWSKNDFFEVVDEILYVAGLDPCRRVFISYKRTECTALSEQLFVALSKKRCDVFLDRFCVPPAWDFQEKLVEDLADKSLVLVLESPTLMDSKWVQYELNFAKMNRIGILAIRLPNQVSTSQVSGIQSASIIELRSCEYINSQLTPKGLRKIIRQVLRESRIAYLKRLFELKSGLKFGLNAHGVLAKRDPSGMLLAQSSSCRSWYGLWATPMVPKSLDFYKASESLSIYVKHRCIVSPAHAYAGQDRRSVTQWLSRLTSISLYTPSQIRALAIKIQGGKVP